MGKHGKYDRKNRASCSRKRDFKGNQHTKKAEPDITLEDVVERENEVREGEAGENHNVVPVPVDLEVPSRKKKLQTWIWIRLIILVKILNVT